MTTLPTSLTTSPGNCPPRDYLVLYYRYPERMTTSTPERKVPDLSFMLAHAAHVLATRMTAAFAEIGITPRDYCVLNHAAAGELTQIELARLSDLDKTTMVVTLDELEEAGYAERRPSRADRRARVVVVTDEGRRLVAAGHEIAERVHQEVLAARPANRQLTFAAFQDPLPSAHGPLIDARAAPAQRPRPGFDPKKIVYY